jgi:hypothetical protein
MNAYELASRIISEYRQARVPVVPSPGRLYRGESRSVSSIIEDVIAYALSAHLPKSIKILINQPMRFNGISIKPDLTIVKGDTILQLCDIKMDLGYKRSSFLPWLQDWGDRMRALRSQTTSIRLKDNGEYTGSVRTLKMSNGAYFNVFLVSGTNIARQALQAIQQAAKSVHCCRLFVFSSRVHPNTYGIPESELVKLFPVDTTAYRKFIEVLKK